MSTPGDPWLLPCGPADDIFCCAVLCRTVFPQTSAKFKKFLITMNVKEQNKIPPTAPNISEWVLHNILQISTMFIFILSVKCLTAYLPGIWARKRAKVLRARVPDLTEPATLLLPRTSLKPRWKMQNWYLDNGLRRRDGSLYWLSLFMQMVTCPVSANRGRTFY